MTIASVPDISGWAREGYTILVLGVGLYAAVKIAGAIKPLVDSRLKVEEQRTMQEEARRESARSVERTAHELHATVKEVGRVAEAQARNAEIESQSVQVRSAMVQDLVRLQERSA